MESPEGGTEPVGEALPLLAVPVNLCTSNTATDTQGPAAAVRNPTPADDLMIYDVIPTASRCHGDADSQDVARGRCPGGAGSPASTRRPSDDGQTHQVTMEVTDARDALLQLNDSRTEVQSPYLKLLCPSDQVEFDTFDCRWRHCDQRFLQQEALVSHVNDIHVKMERDVEYRCHWAKCPRNGKGFNARYKMLIHIRTHTNEKPHRCSLCSKSFSRLENLKIHNRSHTGEKPYVCPVDGCSKAYSNSSDRFKHVRTHLTEKPYTCKMPGCNKKYTDPSSLRKHVKTNGHFSCHAARDLRPGACPVRPGAGPARLLVNHALPTQVISIQGSMLHISTLASNPLLSSALMTTVNTQTTSTQTDGVASSGRLCLLAGDSPVPAELQEAGRTRDQQELPLDLTTGPILAADQEEEDAASRHYSTIWRLISPE